MNVLIVIYDGRVKKIGIFDNTDAYRLQKFLSIRMKAIVAPADHIHCVKLAMEEMSRETLLNIS